MKEKWISIQELAEITNINAATLRVYLDNYTISKYVSRTKIKSQNNRYKLAVKLCKRFAYRFCDYLRLRRKLQAIELFVDYFEEMEHGNK